MRYFNFIISCFLFAACGKVASIRIKIIPTEGNGLTIPALTTVLTCGKDSAYQPFANTVGNDYYVYHIYNTGDCKIKVEAQEFTPAGMVAGANSNSNEVSPRSQLTVAFNAPAAGNKTRFVVHCLAGTTGANNCTFNFKFYRGNKLTDNEWQKNKEYFKGTERDETIKPINPGNCKTDSATLWVVKNLTDAELEVAAYFKNNGTCPATCYVLSDEKKLNSGLEMPSKDKTAAFTDLPLKKGKTITFKGLCKEYAMTPDCTIGIDSLKFR